MQPGPARCTVGLSTGFNPHPARRPDATAAAPRKPLDVTFQSSSGQKAGMQPLRRGCRAVRSPGFNPYPPEGRIQPSLDGWHLTAISAGFNPHPARKAGCNGRGHAVDVLPGQVSISSGLLADATRVTVCLGCIRVAVFQSSSGQKAGCNLRTDGMIVSISFSRFQSSSGQKAGCNNLEKSPSCRQICRFQSASGQKAGCNLDNPRWVLRRQPSFNPHPARRPDATR